MGSIAIDQPVVVSYLSSIVIDVKVALKVNIVAFMFDLLKSAILLAFGAYIGAILARRWQHRNWLEQQQVSDIEKKYIELRALFDEFVRVASRRHIRARRLLWALRSRNQNIIEDRLKEYDKSVLEWNETYNHALQVRLVMVLDQGTRIRSAIDYSIASPFVEVGQQLESGVRAFRSGSTQFLAKSVAEEASKKLDEISNSIAIQGREIFKVLNSTNEARLDGQKRLRQKVLEGKLDEVPTIDLLKTILRPGTRSSTAE